MKWVVHALSHEIPYPGKHEEHAACVCFFVSSSKEHGESKAISKSFFNYLHKWYIIMRGKEGCAFNINVQRREREIITIFKHKIKFTCHTFYV